MGRRGREGGKGVGGDKDGGEGRESGGTGVLHKAESFIYHPPATSL